MMAATFTAGYGQLNALYWWTAPGQPLTLENHAEMNFLNMEYLLP